MDGPDELAIDEGGDVGTAASGLSQVENFKALRKILARLNAIAKEDDAISGAEAQLGLGELELFLAEKFRRGCLNTGEVRLRSALSIWRCQTLSGLDALKAYETVIQDHLEMSFNCNGSAVNITAFLLYTSLLLNLHYTHKGILPVENELTMVDTDTEEDVQDVIAHWTGLRGGPIMRGVGQYDNRSIDIGHLRSTEESESWEQMLGVERMRTQLREAYSRIAGDILHSHKVWALFHQFEITHLPAPPSPNEVEQVQTMYQSRLRAPHAQIDSTLQSYSTFVSKYMSPNEYEGAMTLIYKLVTPAKETWSSIEAFEMQLGTIETQQMTAQWSIWKNYLSWVARTFTSTKKSASKLHLDVEGVCSLYERAIASCGLPSSCIEDLYSKDGRPLSKGELMTAMGNTGESKEVRKQREEEQLKAEANASLDLWKRYLVFLTSAKASASITSDVCSRAGRAHPTSGKLQGQILRVLCQLRRSKAQIDSYFADALRQVSSTSASLSSVTDLLIAWLDVQRELVAGDLLLKGGAKDLSEAVGILAQDADSFLDIYSMMTFALNTLKERNILDDELRIERLTSEWCLRGGLETAALAESIWDKVIHVQSSNSLSWLEASRFHRQRNTYQRARSMLRQGLSRREITSDKKVALAEDLVSFEHIFGSAAEIEWAMERLDAEREKSWTEYYANYAAVSQDQQHQSITNADVANDIIMTDGDTAGEKRKAVEGERPSIAARPVLDNRSDHKRGREGDNKPTRDRENSSVLVDGLPLDATQDDIITLFKDCGEIREVAGPKVISSQQSGESSAAALVEFTSRDSIPAARSRQLKIIRSSQVDINMGWQCTLYVTNFGQEYDSDGKMRELFDSFGRIFDIRWPSKKFANSRRFCYIQYCNAQSAQAALSLHEMEMKNIETGETIKMQVFLSDPNRKKVRSDAQSNDRELFISGLPRGVSEEELSNLFGQGVEGVRIPKHPDGRNKGIAFVDMKTALDAQAALGQSKEVEGGLRIKGKLITVTVADNIKGGSSASAATNTTADDRKSSSIRVRGLPLDAQEAIIQQLFEAQLGAGSVRKVLWTPGEAGRGTAIVELQDVATAGRAALIPSVEYDETHLLELQTMEARGAADTSYTHSNNVVTFAPRQAARGRGRGRGGLGFVRRGALNSAASSSDQRQDRSSNPQMDLDSANEIGPMKKKSQNTFRDMLK